MTTYANPLHRQPDFHHADLTLSTVNLAEVAEPAVNEFAPAPTSPTGGPGNKIRAEEMIDSASEMGGGSRQHVNFLIVFLFILELLVLIFVCVLEYFLRMTDVFPVRHLNFSCTDPDISYTKAAGEASYGEFAYHGDISYELVLSMCFCLPPVVILVSEIALWAFTEEEQKTVLALSRHCHVPQVIRRILRFIGAFLFGLLITMIFTDVVKLLTGRLRPRFLEICQPDKDKCEVTSLNDDDICQQADQDELRDARLSFPSMHASMTAFAACYLAVYLHHVIRAPGVRIMRPFLSLSFIMLSVLCCVARYGLYHSHWTDVLVGFILGVVVAVYIGVFVLGDFLERLGSQRLYSRLTGFLKHHRQRELRELYQEERVETHGYFCPHHPSNTDLSSPGLVIPRPHLHSLPTTGNGNAPNGHMRSPEGPVNESTTDPVEVVHSTSVHAEMVHSGSVHGGSSTNLAEERNSEVQLRRNRQQQNTFQRDLERTLDAYRHSGDNMGYSHM